MEMNTNMHPPFTTLDDLLEFAIQSSYSEHTIPSPEQFQASWKQMDSILQKSKSDQLEMHNLE